MPIDTLRDHEFNLPQSDQARIACRQCGQVFMLDDQFKDRAKISYCPGPPRTMQYRYETTITGEVLRFPIGYR